MNAKIRRINAIDRLIVRLTELIAEDNELTNEELKQAKEEILNLRKSKEVVLSSMSVEENKEYLEGNVSNDK